MKDMVIVLSQLEYASQGESIFEMDQHYLPNGATNTYTGIILLG